MYNRSIQETTTTKDNTMDFETRLAEFLAEVTRLELSLEEACDEMDYRFELGEEDRLAYQAVRELFPE